MKNIKVTAHGKEFTFKVEFKSDYSCGAPWDNSDCHGDVSDWTSRDKLPGELVLSRDGRQRRYYDYAGAVKRARADGWGCKECDGSETKGERAAKSAMVDFEFLRGWCNDEWAYVGVIVTLLDNDGEETDVSVSLWCVETLDDYHETIAVELADEIADAYGSQWGEVKRTTYANKEA